MDIEKEEIHHVAKKTKINQNQIAASIVIAGLIIAGAILLKGQQNTPIDGNQKLSDIKIEKVKSDEHILGNPKAKVVIVEYSDTECPYCKMFHETMNKVIKENTDKVAWVYRHYPIAQLHSKAFNEALATECAWEQGGNDSFWKYINELYSKTPSNDGLDVTEIPKIATSVGLNIDTFYSCLSTEKYASKINDYMTDGTKAGISGTPQSFILKNGKIVDTIQGAQPYEVVMGKIESALK